MSHHIRISSDEAANVIVVEDEAKGERVLFGVPVIQDTYNDLIRDMPPSVFEHFLRYQVQYTLGATLTDEDVRQIRRLAGCEDSGDTTPPE